MKVSVSDFDVGRRQRPTLAQPQRDTPRDAPARLGPTLRRSATFDGGAAISEAGLFAVKGR
jgi:hypothetical protein